MQEETYLLSTKELNTSSCIDRLLNSSIYSFKVEGRMRSLYYLATVIGCYRKIIDAYYNNKLTEEFLLLQEKILSIDAPY